MDLEDMELSPELMAKVKACCSPEELFALAKEEEGNWIRSSVAPDADSRILTCFTCARTPGKYGMRALFAVLEEA